MKTRADLIKCCCYPPLPENSLSVRQFLCFAREGSRHFQSGEELGHFQSGEELEHFQSGEELERFQTGRTIQAGSTIRAGSTIEAGSTIGAGSACSKGVKSPPPQIFSHFWLGGRLTGSANKHFFSLSAQFCQIKCFVAKECFLFFNFGKDSKNIRWQDVFFLLKEGDHLLISLDCCSLLARDKNQNNLNRYNKISDTLQSFVWESEKASVGHRTSESEKASVGYESSSLAHSPKTSEIDIYKNEIKNIKKLVLVSVNKKNSVNKKKRVFVSSSVLADRQKDWFVFLDNVHEGMKKIGLEQVTTATLVDCPGTEPAIDLFETRLCSGREGREKKQLLTKAEQKKTGDKKLFLVSSPEINMKSLLCRGWTDIYEIKKCFRNNENGPLNSLEFYLLEWYRAYSGLNVLLADIQYLFNFLSKTITGNPFLKLRKISMQELFKKHINMEMYPASSQKDFMQELRKHNIPFRESDDIEDLFHLLFLNKIEPFIDPKEPLIVYDYPPFQKAYARVGAGGWASRFELFWKGMELANAFDEVIEAGEQELRFKEDNLSRSQRGKQPVPPSYKLLDDMKGGMPPTSGVALGLDRLFLAFKGLKDINSVRV